jgi:aminobenzoyl-glutamate utilization protein A
MAYFTDHSLVEIRRDLHAHPEAGWKEFRTTALVAETLDERGFTLHLGSDAVAVEERLGVPSNDELAAAEARARDEGAPEGYLDRMDGVTGLVAEKCYGEGPTVGVRVDMDALERTESGADDHRPVAEGFASTHPAEMHACGHDGHTAIGIGIARAFDAKGFDGTLKLFFQPAEEGGRGGKSMSETAHLDDVDTLFGLHLGLGEEMGTVVAGFDNPLSNAKIDVVFEGEPAHAGAAPNEGRNAVQALGTALQNLYGIPRHADGVTRINVGVVHAVNAQNVVAEEARMRVEVRGEDATLNESMLDRARRVLEQSAEMHDVGVETSLYGMTTTFQTDETAVRAVADAAAAVEGVDTVRDHAPFGGSEDASFLVRRVQATGGTATYVGIGASNVAGHHTARFDFDESALAVAVDLVSGAIRRVV